LEEKQNFADGLHRRWKILLKLKAERRASAMLFAGALVRGTRVVVPSPLSVTVGLKPPPEVPQYWTPTGSVSVTTILSDSSSVLFSTWRL
jgi:hypothetical protein